MKGISGIVLCMLLIGLFFLPDPVQGVRFGPGAGNVALASVTYYVSSFGGNDANDGLSPQTAFRTIAQVNSLNLQAGDAVLFKCGDVWRAETLQVAHSGAAGSPITFGSYPAGCSNQPTLSGSQPIAGWIDEGGHVYSANLSGGANTGRFPNGINQLFRDGQRLTLGRWPNLNAGDGGYSTVDGYTASRDLVDNELPAENWAGAVIHLKAMRWYIVNRRVSSSSGTTLHLEADTSCWTGTCVGWGYFINNHLKTLDQEGEWHYDDNSKKVYVYSSGGAPANDELEGSVVLRTDDRYWGGVVIGQDYGSAVSYVVIENLEIKNWYLNGISTPTNYDVDDGGNWVIRHNTIRDVDDTGIKLAVWVYAAQDGINGWRGGRQVEVSDNVVDGANHFGIDVYSRESVFTGNEIRNIGLVQNLGKSGLGCGYTGSNCTENGDGIRIKLDLVSRSAYGNQLQYNRLDKIAYNGIDVFGPGNIFEYNFIRQACITKGDCGGLRTFGRDSLAATDVHDITIRNNIIVDTIGNTDGAHSAYRPLFGMGLYIDHYSRDVQVVGNTIVSSTIGGILYQDSTGVIRDNTLYNNASGTLYCGQVNVGPEGYVVSEFTGNILYGLKDNAQTLSLSSQDNLAASNYNYFFHPWQAKNIDVNGSKTLQEWQAYSGKDALSKKNWFTQNPGETPLSEVFYNDSLLPVTINLGYKKYLDLDQNEVIHSLSLQPFESRVLIQNGELSVPDLTVAKQAQGQVDFAPGEPITFTLSVENQGTAAAAGVVLTDSLSPAIISATWQASPSLGGAAVQTGTRYVWNLPDLPVGAAGTITLTGVLSFTPQAVLAVVNQVHISTTSVEMDYNNNSALVILGGAKLYLPLIMRNR